MRMHCIDDRFELVKWQPCAHLRPCFLISYGIVSLKDPLSFNLKESILVFCFELLVIFNKLLHARRAYWPWHFRIWTEVHLLHVLLLIVKPIDTLLTIESLWEYLRYIIIVFSVKVLDAIGLCLQKIIGVAVLIQFQAEWHVAWEHWVIHHDWIDAWKEENRGQDHQDKSKCETEPLEELLIPRPLRVLFAWLAVVVGHLALIEVVEGVVEFEPLKQVEAGDGHGPVDDHLHLPEERHGLVQAKGPHGQEPGVADERRLERGLRVAVS